MGTLDSRVPRAVRSTPGRGAPRRHGDRCGWARGTRSTTRSLRRTASPPDRSRSLSSSAPIGAVKLIWSPSDRCPPIGGHAVGALEVGGLETASACDCHVGDIAARPAGRQRRVSRQSPVRRARQMVYRALDLRARCQSKLRWGPMAGGSRRSTASKRWRRSTNARTRSMPMAERMSTDLKMGSGDLSPVLSRRRAGCPLRPDPRMDPTRSGERQDPAVDHREQPARCRRRPARSESHRRSHRSSRCSNSARRRSRNRFRG